MYYTPLQLGLVSWESPYTLNKKIIKWTRQFHGHGAAQEIPCPMKEFSWFCCHSIFLGKHCTYPSAVSNTVRSLIYHESFLVIACWYTATTLQAYSSVIAASTAKPMQPTCNPDCMYTARTLYVHSSSIWVSSSWQTIINSFSYKSVGKSGLVSCLDWLIHLLRHSSLRLPRN